MGNESLKRKVLNDMNMKENMISDLQRELKEEMNKPSFTQMYNFDPSKYIIRLGDTNNDFNLNASDASDTLRLYAQLSTESDFSITAEHLKHYDVNSDGIINASDASAILSYYAFLSTGGEDSIKDFLNTP